MFGYYVHPIKYFAFACLKRCLFLYRDLIKEPSLKRNSCNIWLSMRLQATIVTILPGWANSRSITVANTAHTLYTALHYRARHCRKSAQRTFFIASQFVHISESARQLVANSLERFNHLNQGVLPMRWSHFLRRSLFSKWQQCTQKHANALHIRKSRTPMPQ